MKRLVLYKVKVPKYDRNGQVALVTELSVGCLGEVTGRSQGRHLLLVDSSTQLKKGVKGSLRNKSEPRQPRVQ